jgi:hypothetical protein
MTWRTLAVALAACGAAGLGSFNGPHTENTAASIAERSPAPPEPALATIATPVRDPAAGDSSAPGSVLAGVSPTEGSAVKPVLTAPAAKAERRPPPPAPALVTTAMRVRVAAAGNSSVPESALSFADVSATEGSAVEPVLTDPAPTAERQPAPLAPALVTTATRVGVAAAGDSSVTESVLSPAVVSATEGSAAEPVLTDPAPKPAPATGMQLASVPTAGEVDDGLKPPARSIAPSDQCVTDTCIDEYLFSLYERTPKLDSNKVTERIKVTVTKDGKTRTVTKTVTSYVAADFTWKDPAAAQRRGMSVKDYVIDGMDHGFKLKLYGALRAMDDAGLMPGITSAFRDDYRQSIATGKKAASDSSFHGGSRRGGYGHGLAADLVSIKGDTRAERSDTSEELWQWIDAHDKQLGIGRPYRDRDPPHVGPVDGTEYIVKRGLANAQRRALQTKKVEKPRLEPTALAVRTEPGATKHASPAKPPKLSSLQKGAPPNGDHSAPAPRRPDLSRHDL